MVGGGKFPIMGGVQADQEPPEGWWPLVAEWTNLEVITSLGTYVQPYSTPTQPECPSVQCMH